MDNWTIISSNTVIADRWINLRTDRVITQQGIVLDPYYVLTYPDWVHVFAVTPDQQCILVRQYRHAAAQAFVELPCGAMDETDVSPVSAASRELLEETGYKLTDARIIASVFANPASHTNKIHIVIGNASEPPEAASPGPGEELTTQLVPIESLTGMCIRGEIGQSMHIASIFLGLSALCRANI